MQGPTAPRHTWQAVWCTRGPWRPFEPLEPRHAPVVHAEWGVGGARDARRPPTPMRIPRSVRGAPAQALAAPPLRAPHGAPGGFATRAEAQPAHVPACERDVHAGLVRGSRTAYGCRPRSRGSLAGEHGGALARGVGPGAQSYGYLDDRRTVSHSHSYLLSFIK